MNDFFSFRTMITPIIIQILFWIGVATSIIIGIGYIVVGSRYYGGPAPLYGVMILIFGPLAVRIYCEILIIFFRINETLTEIKHDLDGRRVAPPVVVTPPPPIINTAPPAA
jgi:hypothetical protein